MWWKKKEEKSILLKTTIQLIKETRFSNLKDPTTGSLDYNEVTSYNVRTSDYWVKGSSNWINYHTMGLVNLSESDAKKAFEYLIKNNGNLVNSTIIDEKEIINNK